jgi:peroxiredoxin
MRLAVLLLCSAAVYGSGKLSNRPAPGFSLPDSSFEQFDPQNYRGKVLLVEVMQTRCPHCAQFSRILNEVTEKYKGKVAVLSIVNPPDNQETVSQFVSREKLTFPILFDCGQVSASYLKVTPSNPQFAIPHIFLIDREGTIRNDYGYSPETRISLRAARYSRNSIACCGTAGDHHNTSNENRL